MSNEYVILMKKEATGSQVKNSLTAFSCVCTSDMPFQSDWETKELTSRDWADENGEDTYIPAQMKMKAYDMDVPMCYKGGLGTAYQKLKAFKDYLTGADGEGCEIRVYLPYQKIGRKGCYLLAFSDFTFGKSNMDESLAFTIKLRVTDPVTDITLSE